MPSEYRKWWDFIRGGNTQHEMYVRWFAEHTKELPTIESMISIGAGCGDLDYKLIHDYFKDLKSYIGVEPDPDNNATLAQIFDNTSPSIKAQIVSQPMGEWTGPSEPVDLILAVQVFYYFKDPVAILKQLYSWLKPGGILVIGHSYSDSMYAGIAAEAGLKGDYWVESLVNDLQRAELSDFLKVYKLQCTIDHGTHINREMLELYFKLNILKGEELTENNLAKCLEIFGKKFEHRHMYQTYHNGLLLIQKST